MELEESEARISEKKNELKQLFVRMEKSRRG